MVIQTTFTASENTPVVKEMPAGVLSKSCTLTLSTTATASSIMLLLKVPDQATILDFMFFIESGGANGTWSLGLQLPEGSTSGSWTLTRSAISPPQSDSASFLARPIGINLPLTVSISTEQLQRWAWVTAINAVAVSASAIMRCTVFYTMDGS